MHRRREMYEWHSFLNASLNMLDFCGCSIMQNQMMTYIRDSLNLIEFNLSRYYIVVKKWNILCLTACHVTTLTIEKACQCVVKLLKY